MRNQSAVHVAAVLFAAGVLGLSACGDSNKAPPAQGGSAATAEAVPAGGTAFAFTQKVKVKSGAEQEAFTIKPKEDGAKVVDPAENEICRLKLDGDKIKIKDVSEKTLGYVKLAEAGRFKIEAPDQQTVLFRVLRQEDGDLKVEDGAQALLYRIKKREYGYEIEDAADKSLFKAKLKEGKTSLRDASDRTVLYTKDPCSTAAFAAFGLDKLDRPQQAGLFLRLTLSGF